MAAVTSAIIGATVATAGLVNTIEQQNQAKRAANQAKNGAQEDAASALAAQQQADATAQQQRAANQARTNQRNRTPGVGGQVAMMPTLMGTQGAPATAPAPGSNTLLGQ